MSAAAASPISVRSERRESAGVRKLDRLALLYEGILSVIGRVQTGRQRVHDPEDFRQRMKQALREIASSAARRGYAAEDVNEANFAVVAFLDEAILSAPDSSAEDWVGKSLGQDLFNQRSAGELFFKHLEKLRADRDSPELAEVLEVYYLCLLLGYEGKFAGGAKGELLMLMSNLRERIDRILVREAQFSPDAALPSEPVRPQTVADATPRQARLFALAALVFALLCFLGFYLQLHYKVSAIDSAIEQRLAGGYAP